MKEKHAPITNQSLKKNRLLGSAHVSKKRRGLFVPQEKTDGGSIK